MNTIHYLKVANGLILVELAEWEYNDILVRLQVSNFGYEGIVEDFTTDGITRNLVIEVVEEQ